MIKSGNLKDSKSGYREYLDYENYLKDKYNIGNRKKREAKDKWIKIKFN